MDNLKSNYTIGQSELKMHFTDAAELFEETLKIGEAKINNDTKREFIAKIKSIEFICPSPITWASKGREARVK